MLETAFLTLLSQPSQSIFTLISTVCNTHTQKKKKKQKQQKRQINQIWHGQASKQRDQYHTPWNRESDKMDIYVYLHCFSFLPWGGNSEIVWEKVQSTHFSSLFTKGKAKSSLMCLWEREREREILLKFLQEWKDLVWVYLIYKKIHKYMMDMKRDLWYKLSL